MCVYVCFCCTAVFLPGLQSYSAAPSPSVLAASDGEQVSTRRPGRARAGALTTGNPSNSAWPLKTSSAPSSIAMVTDSPLTFHWGSPKLHLVLWGGKSRERPALFLHLSLSCLPFCTLSVSLSLSETPDQTPRCQERPSQLLLNSVAFCDFTDNPAYCP